eukprot:TRINITY_DN2936_c0_g1_i4.p1 TRINITY_DN2936_c0_g1~~TRINITY_DN2936_c0_g1_i4.p1  ORF type:complete len:708 (+),score=238.48 TRINITY_DN2936_c0_g1_i4:70-2193(+)
MLIPAFQISLNHAILPGLATVGKFDGKNCSLTCATDGGRLFVHCPQEDSTDGASVRFLSMNKEVSGLASGALDPSLGRDVLLIGMHNQLLVFDVEENADLIFKEVPDGINSLTFGKVGSSPLPLAVVGGNCSIQGFDFEGNEAFWTVTGDVVSSLAFCDVEGDGLNELIVGSEDCEIRIFQDEEVVSEITESDGISALTNIQKFKYGFALENGTIGVYNRTKREWRKKQKNRVSALASFDLDGDGVPELVAGLANGRLEVRNDNNGELIYKDQFERGVAAVLSGEYTGDGREHVIVCAEDGEVRGYLPAEAQLAGNLMDVQLEEGAMHELTNRKQELLQELRNYEKTIESASGRGHSAQQAGVVPPDTHIQVQSKHWERGLLIQVKTNNDACIKSIVAFGENIFENSDSHVLHPRTATNCLELKLTLAKDVATSLKLTVLVGSWSGSQFRVFEETVQIPKFSMYAIVQHTAVPPSSLVFELPVLVTKLDKWLQSSFWCVHGLSVSPSENSQFVFKSLHAESNGHVLLLQFSPQAGLAGKVSIHTNNMELAGDLVQELASSCGVEQLEAVAEFPTEMAEFQTLLERVEQYNAVRMQLTAEMADRTAVVKTLVVKAEDSRLLGDMPNMKTHYSGLYNVNNELLGELAKRQTNHKELLQCLKQVNNMIQKAARLRVGTAKADVITNCRAAIKANNVSRLFEIIRLGAVSQ